MGKSSKARHYHHPGKYPYCPVRAPVNVLVMRSPLRQQENGQVAGVAGQGASPFWPAEPPGKAHDLKRLEFLRTYGEYYWSKANQLASTVYSTGRAYTPATLDTHLRAMEERVSSFSLPIVCAVTQQTESVLRSLDGKVDGVFHAASELFAHNSFVGDSFERQRGYHSPSLRAAGEEYLHKLEEAWCKLIALPPVNKLLESTAPSVDFTRRKYLAAHDVVVGSTSYNKALATAASMLDQVKDTFVYKAAASKLYPVISPLADPALSKITHSACYSAVVDHLKPTGPSSDSMHHADQAWRVLSCAQC